MGGTDSKSASYQNAAALFSRDEQNNIEMIYTKLCKGNVKRGFQSQNLKEFAGDKINGQLCNHLFCHMLLCLEGVSNPTFVDKEAFTISLAHILKATPSETCSIICQLAAGSPNCVTVLQLKELLLEISTCYQKILSQSDQYKSWKFSSGDLNVFCNTLLGILLDENTTGDKLFSSDQLEQWLSGNSLLLQIMNAVFHDLFPIALVDSVPNDSSRNSFLPVCEHTPWHKFQTLLDLPTVLYLNSYLPVQLRHKWRLLFASNVHGENFSLLVKHIIDQGPSILIIRDNDDHVFGGFASHAWQIKPQFQGSSASFLFAMRPRLEAYLACGYNENFMYLNQNQETMPNGLGMGGQLDYFGLWLSQDFGQGHSKAKPHCSTFNSPQLSKSDTFQVHTLEVWGVGPSPEELRAQIADPDEQISILDKDPAAKAMLSLIGKGPVSEGLRETDATAQTPEDHNLPPL